MESETSVGSLESVSVNEKRQRMLARLDARHTGDATGMKTSSSETEFDKLLAKATCIMNSSELNIEPEFLQELEIALTLIPLGRQSRRLKEVLNVLRSQMQKQIGLTHQQAAFSFSTKKENATASEVQKAAVAKCNPLDSTQTTTKLLSKIPLQHGKELVIRGDDGEDVTINDVTNSMVRVPFKASAVHIKSVKDSTLIFAPVKTSLLIRNCENLTVVVAAQQIRTHDSHQIRFYIEVRGALIIEDCDGIEVAPYNVVGFQQDTQNNNWRNVQDFSWLSSEEHSPNWKIMEENSAKYFNL
uniref:Bm7080 n=1 Tax=Brugia malayi TaxID=6279 RepID=A0A0J9Y912_BRUMA|nr:Bm7080 [Brugia malayi]